MEVMKRLRQQQIRDLIGTRPIRTQQELAAALRDRGFRATQATVSRDVAEMGLVKISRDDGERAYAVPARPGQPETSADERLAMILRDLPIKIRPAGLMLVLRARDCRGARPDGLARGRRIDRGRRHGVRRVRRPGVTGPAAKAPSPPRDTCPLTLP